MALLPQSIADLVTRDHLPRQATADDLSLHVFYWGGTITQSMEAADWLAQRGPLPTDPTPEESAAAILALQQAAQQAQADAAQLRQQVLALAQSTVGMRVDAAFTTAQLRSLLAILLYKDGALNNDLTIRPLADRIRP